MFMYKAGHNLLPMSCKQHATCNKVKHSYKLRKMREFEVLHFRTNMRKQSITIFDPSIWNSYENVDSEDSLRIMQEIRNEMLINTLIRLID